MHGTITAFDAVSGHGKLVCTESGAQYHFCNPEPCGGAMRRGDSVVFEPVEKGLAHDVVPVWRRSATTPGAAKPVATPMAVANDRDTCMCCSKLMTPTLALLGGVAARSFCPFCGEVHRDFTSPARTRPNDYVAEGLFSAAITAVFTIFL